MREDNQNLFRKIPGVDRLLDSHPLSDALSRFPRSVALRAVHRVLEDLRREIRNGSLRDEAALELEAVSARALHTLEEIARPSLQSVINATGVVVHTNLGRSILPERVLARFGPLAGAYSNLEYDLDEGRRGSRYTHVEAILRELTGAEGAMVVNNNAAAVLLCLDTLAGGGEVVVSRGQLVEIGGSFRIPEVMRKSGARMVEVGTTNKTHLRDYEEVIGPETALLLKVHTSNFHVVGFTQEVSGADLAALGRRHGIPVMEDLGSGCFVDFSRYGLLREPTVQEVLDQGVDLVTFSGDKLLGGPQAGIILGRKDLVEAVKKNQLARPLRIDKLTLIGLEETLRIYRDEETAIREIPTLRMLLQDRRSLLRKARRLRRLIGDLDTRNFTVTLTDTSSKVGGGALPLLDLPSRAVCLSPGRLSSAFMEQRLRSHDPPVITRVEKEQVLMDVRTIQDRELKVAARAVRKLAAYRSEGA